MKKLISGLGISILTLFSLSGVVSAKVDTASGSLALKAPKAITFTCGGLDYKHTLNSVENNLETGDFTGTGTYNKDTSYGWNIEGNVTGDNITYKLVYIGTDAGYTLNGVGKIASNGSISGTTDGNCQTFTMGANTIVNNNGKKGPIVKMGRVKKMSAKVKTGIPVQSRGNKIEYANVERVPGPWSLKAPKAIVLVCGGENYAHTLNSVENDLETGDFTGTGTYNADTSYAWNITGKISGDDINYKIVYTGPDAYTINGAGKIASDGSIQASADNNCESFSMAKGSAKRFTGNHGQWVRMGKVKRTAARSSVGMPVKANKNGYNNNGYNNNNQTQTPALKAPKAITFTCDGLDYKHTLNSVENNLETGDFTGTGTYNKDTSYGWNIVGNITGENITYQLVYTGTDAGYTLNGVGKIASNGSVSGTTDGNCQTFTMGANTVVNNNGKKGPIVKMGRTKKMSAKVKSGIPVQSRNNESI